MTAEPPHVELRGIRKHFGGAQAVNGVDLEIARGQVHALVGENGAGKSTVAKIVAGAITPSAGELRVLGAPVSFSAPAQALDHGIAMIDQELAMVPARSVLDNVFLGSESRRAGLLDAREQRRRFAALVERTGFVLDPDADVRSLRVAEQQKVEILRALARDAQLIIMDEPTAPLTQVESDRLYDVIRALREQGTTIVFVSHFLEEVLAISDTVTVMRDGKRIRTAPAADETPATLIRGMLGRPLDGAYPARRAVSPAPPVLEVRGLSARHRFADVSFSLRPGEIVGLAGLVGSGRSELGRALFGADPVDGGEVAIDGAPVRIRSPREAIRRGLVLLPESRKHDGLVMMRSVAENIVLARLDLVSAGGVVKPRRERAEVARVMADLDVRCSGPATPVATLSGGNQQKVLFGKWLVSPPRILIVDEPTRGVDIGAKRAIYDLISGLAAVGMAVLLISSELEEVLGMSDRVMVMHRGRIAAVLSAEEADEETVLAAAFGAAGEAA